MDITGGKTGLLNYSLSEFLPPPNGHPWHDALLPTPSLRKSGESYHPLKAFPDLGWPPNQVPQGYPDAHHQPQGRNHSGLENRFCGIDAMCKYMFRFERLGKYPYLSHQNTLPVGRRLRRTIFESMCFDMAPTFQKRVFRNRAFSSWLLLCMS